MNSITKLFHRASFSLPRVLLFPYRLKNGSFTDHFLYHGVHFPAEAKRKSLFGERNASEVCCHLSLFHYCGDTRHCQCSASHDASAWYALYTPSSWCDWFFLPCVGSRKLGKMVHYLVIIFILYCIYRSRRAGRRFSQWGDCLLGKQASILCYLPFH